MRLRATTAAFLLVAFQAAAGDGVPLVIDDGDKIGEIMARMQGMLSGIIDNIGEEARLTMGNGYQLAQLLLSDLHVAYSNKLNETFETLDDQQLKAFQDLKNIINDNERWVRGDIQDAKRTVDDLNALLSTLPGVTDRPIILEVTPKLIGPKSLAASVPISVRGFHLRDPAGKKDPFLEIGDKHFTASGDTNLTFLVPREDIETTDNHLSYANVDLTVFENPDGFFKRIFRTNSVPVTYHLVVGVLPEKLGRFTVERTTRRTERYSEHFVSDPELKVENAFGGGRGPIARGCYYPKDENWHFQISTARAVGAFPAAGGGSAVNDGVCQFDRSSAFGPSGICLEAWASVRDKHWNATTHCHLEVDQYTDVPRVESASDPSRELLWSSETHYAIGENSSAIAEIELFGGITYEVPSTQERKLPFLTVSPDERSGLVLLKPQRVWDPW